MNNNNNMTMMDASFVPYRLAAAYLLEQLEQNGNMQKPVVGILCGSDLSGISNAMMFHDGADDDTDFTEYEEEKKDEYETEADTLIVPYSSVPGFPQEQSQEDIEHQGSSSNKGSGSGSGGGEIVFGKLSGVPTVCFRGERFHSYDGYDIRTVVLPIKVMRCLGVQITIVTNSSTALNPTYRIGDIITVSDHLALPLLSGGDSNPLVGPNDPEMGPRFLPTSNAYPQNLRKLASKASNEIGIIPARNTTHHDINNDNDNDSATYCFVSGASQPTQAECKFLRDLGGDCYGMSTVPEVVTAHHCNIRVLCLSLITAKINFDHNNNNNNCQNEFHVGGLQQDRSKMTMQLYVKQIVKLMRREIIPTLPIQRKISMLSSSSSSLSPTPSRQSSSISDHSINNDDDHDSAATTKDASGYVPSLKMITTATTTTVWVVAAAAVAAVAAVSIGNTVIRTSKI